MSISRQLADDEIRAKAAELAVALVAASVSLTDHEGNKFWQVVNLLEAYIRDGVEPAQ